MALTLDLQSAIARSTVPTVALFFSSLDGHIHAEIDPDRSFHAASTMKVPVMMEAFRLQADGCLRLSDEVPIYNHFCSIADGSWFSTDLAEDSDPTIYGQIGKSLPMIDLVSRMITLSSNLATDILVDRVGAANIQNLMNQLGSPGMEIVRGVEDNIAYRKGIVNKATPRAFANLFTVLAKGDSFGAKDSDSMLEILAGQEHRQGIPRGIPNASRICHKTGNIETSFHDGGLIEHQSGRKFALAILSEGAPFETCSDLVAQLAAICWQAVEK